MNRPMEKVPQGAPRGLLLYWILYRISKSPIYGYQILTELEQKTRGAWRPGAGSIYPLLKKLERDGYIESERTEGRKTDQKRYTITLKGMERLKQAKETFRMMRSKISHMRWVIFDLLDPSEIPEYVVEGSKESFEGVRELVETNIGKITEKEIQLMLREYQLALERQQDWVNNFLNTRVPAIHSTRRRRSA
jgi:DNA-binding PadR family transcriptional regulator